MRFVYSSGVLMLAAYIASAFMSYFLANYVGDTAWQVATVLCIFWTGRISMVVERLIND